MVFNEQGKIESDMIDFLKFFFVYMKYFDILVELKWGFFYCF